MITTAVFVVSVIAGGVAAVSGFGIGSLLTPLLAFQFGTKSAVAAVSIPHFVGTALRLWLLRAHVDRRLLWSFGLTSAAGGLAGALLHARASSPALAAVFGALLVFAGASQVTGLAGRWRFHGWAAWVAGAASGVFGGLVGNQGGIRSAAMFGFDVSKAQFVATATAIALMVDIARMPLYLAAEWQQLVAIRTLLAVAVVGVIGGTIAGGWLLVRVPERRFRQAVGYLLLLLGLATLIRGRV